MRFRFTIALAAILALSQFGSAAAPGGDTPEGWELSWADEFDGPDGSGVDRSKWVPEVGGNGWGNNELEYYRDDVANAYHQGGALVIKAIKERYTGTDGVTRDYTSARLITRGKFEQRYGRYEARIKVPYGQGIWPAFWMLGVDIGRVGGPTCGEIDILENIGREPTIVHGTVHGPGYSGANGIGKSYSLPDNARFADDYHVFAVEWEPKVIRWYVDGALYHTLTPANLPAGTKWVFDHPFFIIMNLAVGGNWPGSPDATTVFPQMLQVDYVRVYRRRPPVVASCEPAGASRNATVDVRISGENFQEGAKVSFGAKVKVLDVTVVSPSELDVRVKVKKKAARGSRDVTVTNLDGTVGTGAAVFEVTS
jgi:beta-glucanase (GH16 family)